MNNAGAIYVEYGAVAIVAAELTRYLEGRGFRAVELAPGAISGRIMIPEKRRRLFALLPAQNGWVTLFEDPRYFAERALAQWLAEALNTRTAWIEVSGNAVGWARAVYHGSHTLEEHYEEVETNFYGEYGVIHFVFDIETTPEEFVAALGLPHDDLHYEAIVEGELPAEAGAPLYLAFER